MVDDACSSALSGFGGGPVACELDQSAEACAPLQGGNFNPTSMLATWRIQSSSTYNRQYLTHRCNVVKLPTLNNCMSWPAVSGARRLGQWRPPSSSTYTP